MILYGSQAAEAETVILFGNCQTNSLAEYLSLTDPEPGRRTYICALNHDTPNLKMQPLPRSVVDRCVLYLEQVDERPGLAVRAQIQAELPARCPRIVFPALFFYSLWPFDDGFPGQSPTDSRAWGAFPYSDRIAREVVAEGLRGEAGLAAYLHRSRAALPEDMAPLLERDFRRFDRQDRQSDMMIGDFVRDNFRHRPLFKTSGHPTGHLMAEYAGRLMALAGPELGWPAAAVADIRARYEASPGIGCLWVPIHPEAGGRLNLACWSPDMTYGWYDERLTFRDYMLRFINHDPAAEG